jgi:hypothetical protein
MQEIQERKEPYLTTSFPVRWRNGILETAGRQAAEWQVANVFTAEFVAGNRAVLDPLTGEFVCPPKPERPYDHTTGQMIDAIKEGEKWEHNGDIVDLGGRYVRCHPDVAIPIWPDGKRLTVTVGLTNVKWRKVEG